MSALSEGLFVINVSNVGLTLGIRRPTQPLVLPVVSIGSWTVTGGAKSAMTLTD